jgi:hypothetical protein
LHISLKFTEVGELQDAGAVPELDIIVAAKDALDHDMPAALNADLPISGEGRTGADADCALRQDDPFVLDRASSEIDPRFGGGDYAAIFGVDKYRRPAVALSSDN